MNILRFVNTTIGQKILMALTGLAIVGFVVAHLTGNLLLYVGPDAINAYAYGLKSEPTIYLIWAARAGLLFFFGFHTIKGIMLTLSARRASPKYAVSHTNKASVFSRSMIYTGVVLLLFVLFHLAHFTFMCINPEFKSLTDELGRHDVYSMVVASFQVPWISLLYIISMLALWMHLCHGASSVFRSLGVSHPSWVLWTDKVGPTIATVLLLGNCSLPLSVWLGFIK